MESTRIKLIRSNVNLLGYGDGCVFYEFQYRMNARQTRWCKTMLRVRSSANLLEEVLEDVRGLRAILEGQYGGD